MTEEEGRRLVIEKALAWCGTPYHHHACVMGAGVDCLRLVHAVYRDAGLVEDIEFPFYSHQEHHNEKETLLEGVLRYAREVEVPKPGDIALYKLVKVFRHGAIVDAGGWPGIIHASYSARLVLRDDGLGGWLGARDRRFFSYW